MPTSVPVPDKTAGDVFTEAMWDSFIKDNINKLLDRGHRVLTVAQFAALTGLEGTKGTVAPDEVYLEVDAANGIEWHLAYESGEATYKWRFLGGPPLYSTVSAVETTTSSTYTALATAGPSIALPRAGDYDVETGFLRIGGTAGHEMHMSYDIGGTGAADADRVAAVSVPTSVFRGNRKTALTAVTLTAKYRTAAGQTGGAADRTMAVRPVRLRHDA